MVLRASWRRRLVGNGQGSRFLTKLSPCRCGNRNKVTYFYSIDRLLATLVAAIAPSSRSPPRRCDPYIGEQFDAVGLDGDLRGAGCLPRHASVRRRPPT